MKRDGNELSWGDRRGVPVGFHERFDRFTGRATLQILTEDGGWSEPIGDGYGTARAELRSAFPEIPFRSDWMDGRFAPMPMGLPPTLALAGGVTLAAGAVVGASTVSAGAAATVALLAAWPLARLRDGVTVVKRGVRTGPAWAPLVPWHEVECVVAEVRGRRARVWTHTPWGSAVGTLPSVLLPALRGRVRRLGGIELAVRDADLDDRYAIWRGPATAIPWGVLLGTAAAAFASPAPWTVLGIGLMVMAATSLLAAAIEARSTGWETGAVLWSTGVYAVLLVAVAIGTGDWLGLK